MCPLREGSSGQHQQEFQPGDTASYARRTAAAASCVSTHHADDGIMPWVVPQVCGFLHRDVVSFTGRVIMGSVVGGLSFERAVVLSYCTPEVCLYLISVTSCRDRPRHEVLCRGNSALYWRNGHHFDELAPHAHLLTEIISYTVELNSSQSRNLSHPHPALGRLSPITHLLWRFRALRRPMHLFTLRDKASPHSPLGALPRLPQSSESGAGCYRDSSSYRCSHHSRNCWCRWQG